MAMFVERRLRAVSRKIRAANEDLAVSVEQHRQLLEESDDAGIRSLVSDDPEAALDASAAQRHRDASAAHIDHLRSTIERLEATQDELLDHMAASLRSTP